MTDNELKKTDYERLKHAFVYDAVLKQQIFFKENNKSPEMLTHFGAFMQWVNYTLACPRLQMTSTTRSTYF